MPLYEWFCKNEKCKKRLDVLRTFDGHRDPPTDDEAGVCPEGTHDWEKKIGVPLMTKGASWGAGKGHWISVLAIAAASLLYGCSAPSRKSPEATVREVLAPHAWCYVLFWYGSTAISCVPK